MTTANAAATHDGSGGLPTSGVRTYARLWISQWIAVVATALTFLVLGLNIYEEFQDSFGLLVVAYAAMFVPLPVLSPLLGALIDRWGQRRALAVSNAGDLATLLTLVVLVLTHTAGLWSYITVLSIVPAFVGDAPGRGWAIPMLVVGLLAVLIVFIAYRSRNLRQVQDDLPDVTPEDEPSAVAPAADPSAPAVGVPAPARP